MQNKILFTTKKVATKAKYVMIDHTSIEKICSTIIPESVQRSSSSLFRFTWTGSILADIIFIFNCVNFCYWINNEKGKWSIKLDKKDYTGSSGLFKAIENFFYTQQYISAEDFFNNISISSFMNILGKNKNLSLITQRVENLLEAKYILHQKYNDSVTNLIKSANNSAVNLTNIIYNDFPSFRDKSAYNNYEVFFLKRAQLTSKMLYDCLKNSGLGHFTDIEKLTLFADYKIPQTLHTLGILKYDKKLQDILKNEIQIPKDSEMEIEIRSACVQAGEIIKINLRKKISGISSAQIDTYLWLMSKKIKPSLPHHKTITTYY